MIDAVCSDARIAQLERQLLHARAGIAKCAQESSHESLFVKWNREVRCVRLTDVATLRARPLRSQGRSTLTVLTVHGERIAHRESVPKVLARHPGALLFVSAGFALNPANIAMLRPVGAGRVMLRMYGSDDTLMLEYRSAARVRAWLDRDAGLVTEQTLQPEVTP